MYGLREQTAYERYDGCLIGRILSQEKGQYRLICEKGELPAELSGRLRHRTQSAADLPAGFSLTELGLQVLFAAAAVAAVVATADRRSHPHRPPAHKGGLR